MSDRAAPRITDRYQLLRKVGQGGMAEVHEARDLHLDRMVAVKFIAASAQSSPEATARFQREIGAMVRHNHPNIVSLYDAGHTDDGRLFLVMELLDGCTLAQMLAEGPMRLSDVLDIGAQLARALDVLHNADVVHRDLHPGNIFLVPGTQGWRLKLLDFGIARELGEAPLTLGDNVLGNPHYMSPEQALGDTVDGRADLYVVGAILVRAITAKPLFEANNPLAVMLKHVHEPLPALDVQPAGLRQLLEELLAKDPEQRPASAFEVAERLGLLADRVRQGARQSGPPPPSPAWSPPRPPAPVPRRGVVRLLQATGLAGASVAALGASALVSGCAGLVFGLAVSESDNTQPVPLSEPVCDLAMECSTGRPTSCATVGRRYALGQGVDPDPERAREWFGTACDMGWYDACVMEHTTLSADPDAGNRDVRWLRSQCQGRDLDACLGLASAGLAPAWQRGWPEVGVAGWLAQECERSNVTACTAVAVLREEGRGMEADPGRAIETLEALCADGQDNACARLGMSLASRGDVADPERGARLLTDACDRGNRDACSAVARLGDGAGIGDAEGAARSACRLGDLGACESLEM